MAKGLDERLAAGAELADLVRLRRELAVRVADLAEELGRKPSTVRRREAEPAPFPGEVRTYRNALRVALERRGDPLARLAALALVEAPHDPRGWLAEVSAVVEAA